MQTRRIGDVAVSALGIAEALRGRSEKVLIATKGGHIYRKGGPWDRNGDPAYLKRAARESLARLGVEAIGLYQFHRPDPTVPYEDSVGALRELLEEGVILMAGISNATIEQIRIADRVLGGRLVSVQNQFSPSYRAGLPELEYCVENEIAFLAYSPLGGIGRQDYTATPFESVGTELGVSPQQVALAWELSLGHCVIPIPGASRPESITDSAQAADLVLTQDQLSLLAA
jgi:aryl-alcohol dehydrogenase-like predicted oxidoreductase